jgi:hypothetical protein
MSVSENWRDLLPHLVPKRLRPLFPGAAGSNTQACWKMGTGAFAPGPLTDDLELVLKVNSTRNGNVVPARLAPLADFQAHLAATRQSWAVDET